MSVLEVKGACRILCTPACRDCPGPLMVHAKSSWVVNSLPHRGGRHEQGWGLLSGKLVRWRLTSRFLDQELWGGYSPLIITPPPLYHCIWCHNRIGTVYSNLRNCYIHAFLSSMTVQCLHGLWVLQPNLLRTVGSDLSDNYLSRNLIYLTEDWGTKSAAYYCIDAFLSNIWFIWQVLREQMTSDTSEPTVHRST